MYKRRRRLNKDGTPDKRYKKHLPVVSRAVAEKPHAVKRPPGRPRGTTNRHAKIFRDAVLAEFQRRGPKFLEGLDAPDFIRLVIHAVPKPVEVKSEIEGIIRAEHVLDAAAMRTVCATVLTELQGIADGDSDGS